MSKSNYSFNHGKGGKAADLISGVKGFSDDRTATTIKLKTEPGHEYEFVLIDNSFASAERYPWFRSTYGSKQNNRFCHEYKGNPPDMRKRAPVF